MAKQLFFMVLLAVLVPCDICGHDLVEYDVPCDHTTEVCICPLVNDNGKTVEVCKLVMDIDLLQTFTRYFVEKTDTTTDSRGIAGRIWYIDANGVERQYGNEGVCGDRATDDCTEAFYVDGYTFRSFIGVNSRIPGPTIIVNQHQLVQVQVNNRLASDSVTIHWHGMHQRDSNWMDGVEHVTQCGILPGGSFTYIFKATQSGTHWYHSHSGAQRTDGLFGALVVQEKEEDITRVMELIGDFEDIPDEHTLTLWDWQQSNSIDLFTKIHSGTRHFEDANGDDFKGTTLNGAIQSRTYSVDGAEVGPVTYWSGLINGRGRHYSVNYNQARLSVFTVFPNDTYRFRLIGAQSLYAFRVSVDEHKLKLIATDGVFVNETNPVDFIIVHSGERYDFLLEAKSESEMAGKNNFVIRGETLEVLKENSPEHVAIAILHYDVETANSKKAVPSNYQDIVDSSNPVSSTCTTSSKCLAVNCPFDSYPSSYNINCLNVHQLRLLEPIPIDDLPHGNETKITTMILNFGFEGSGATSSINGRNMKLPSVPLIQTDPSDEYCDLSQEVSAKCDNNQDPVISPDCYCTHIRAVKSDKTVELVLSAIGPHPTDKANFRFAHPVHLHGHSFHVVDVQYGEYDTSTKELMEGNNDINCRGTKICPNPKWRTGKRRPYDDTDHDSDKINPYSPLKDTVMVPYGGYTVVFFKTDNPGFWFLHCHIEVHQLEGMGLVLKEGDSQPSLPSDLPQCHDLSWTVDKYLKAIDGASANSCYYLLLVVAASVASALVL